MRSLRARVLHLVTQLALSAVVLGAGWLGFRALGDKPPPAGSDRPTARTLVEVIPARAHTGPIAVELGGVVRPHRELVLPAEVAGVVRSRSPNARAGLRVTAGETLFELDTRELELAVRQLDLALQQTRLQQGEIARTSARLQDMLRVAEADLVLRRSEVTRQRDLVARKATSDATVEQAQQRELAADMAARAQAHQLDLSRDRSAQIDLEIRLAEARLERARLDLTRATVVAPCDARVVRCTVETSGFVARGQELIALEDDRRAEVHLALALDDLQLVWAARTATGDEVGEPRPCGALPPIPARVTLNGATHSWDGVLERVEGSGLDERTRLVPCVVVVPLSREPGATLLRGMYVKVTLRVPPGQPLLSLPEGVVRPGPLVWRARNGRLERVPVTIARRSAGVVLVAPGALAEGDSLVTTLLASPRDGMELEVAR